MYSWIEWVVNLIPNWFWGPYGFLLSLNIALTIFALIFSTLLLGKHFAIKSILVVWTVFSLFIPLITPVFFFIYAVLLKMCLNLPQHINFSNETYPEYELEKDSKMTQYGEGGAIAQLTNSAVQDQMKLQALIRLNHHNTTGINQINESMLQNDFDELRLYAYAMLDKQETDLYNKIHSLERQLESTNKEQTLFTLYKALSYYYWELIYLNLAHDDIKQFAINKTQAYLEKALAIQSDGLGIIILNARLKLLQGKKEEAEKLFEKAFRIGSPEGKVIPYLAEIAYKKGNYEDVEKWFSKASPLVYISKLDACSEYWRAYGSTS